jgi:TupA-like ATPgrasp
MTRPSKGLPGIASRLAFPFRWCLAKLAYLRAHSPRWQIMVTLLVWKCAVQAGFISPGAIRALEYGTGRLLGQPLSRRAWDRMTFNDKVTYRRLRVRRPQFAEFSDKLRMRDRVTSVIGEHALPEVLLVAADAAAFSDLVGPFALKANHGSGWVILVDTPRRLTAQELRLAGSWLTADYERVNQEWGYRSARRLIFAEQYLDGPPKDYKFFVFDGRPALIQVDSDRSSQHQRALMGVDWSVVGEHTTYPPPAAPEVRPPNLDTMLTWASALGRGIDFVRVDLYDLGDRVLVGELSCYPASGRAAFRPAHLDVWLGAQWKWATS